MVGEEARSHAPEGNVTAVVIEMEPGRVYVKLIDPIPEPNRAELLLRRTVEHWFGDRPQFVIDRTAAFVEDGVLRGMHVWYHLDDRRAERVTPASRRPADSLAIEVNDQILRQLPKEFVEAVVDDAVKMWRTSRDRRGTVLVISPRRIVVVLDGRVNRGAVLPLALIEPALDALRKADLEAWLESPQSRFLQMRLPESWFLPDDFEAASPTIVEPTFLRTNMTYDGRPGP